MGGACDRVTHQQSSGWRMTCSSASEGGTILCVCGVQVGCGISMTATSASPHDPAGCWTIYLTLTRCPVVELLVCSEDDIENGWNASSNVYQLCSPSPAHPHQLPYIVTQCQCVDENTTPNRAFCDSRG